MLNSVQHFGLIRLLYCSDADCAPRKPPEWSTHWRKHWVLILLQRLSNESHQGDILTSSVHEQEYMNSLFIRWNWRFFSSPLINRTSCHCTGKYFSKLLHCYLHVVLLPFLASVVWQLLSLMCVCCSILLPPSRTCVVVLFLSHTYGWCCCSSLSDLEKFVHAKLFDHVYEA
jgi:hypothetical protein